MAIFNKKERELRALRERCVEKRDAVREKLAGRRFSQIEDYEYDSFYALYTEVASLAGDVAQRSETADAKAFLELKEKVVEKLKRYDKAEDHIYMHLMEAGDAGAIKDLMIAMAIIRRMQREE